LVLGLRGLPLAPPVAPRRELDSGQPGSLPPAAPRTPLPPVTTVRPAAPLDLSAISRMPNFSGRQAGPPAPYVPPPPARPGGTGPTASERAAQVIQERESAAAGLNRVTSLGTVNADYPWSSLSTIVSGGQGVIPFRATAGDTDTTPSDGEGTPRKVVPKGGDSEGTRRDEKPGDYSDEGAALTAELFGQLAARRRAADEELQFAMEREKTQAERLQLAATTARTQVTREFRTLTEDMMRMLAGRGTARAPMVAGRGARRLQMQKDERFGQISQTLADEISALQEMVQLAERARSQTIAQISQEEALLRTAPQLLLPSAAAFGGR
jgi:hypothetical protein